MMTMEIRPDMGYRRGRYLPSGLDALWCDDCTHDRRWVRIGIAERKRNATLILFAHLSESECAEASELLSARECDGGSTHAIAHPQPLVEEDA